MTGILGIVGPKGRNAPADVQWVQERLVHHVQWLGGMPPPRPSGQWDGVTATALTAFQREGAVLLRPSGTVEPRSYTAVALTRDAIPFPRHRLFRPFCWAHLNDTLPDAAYVDAAKRLSCEVAAVKAVAQTETKNRPWDWNGRPTVLFERHLFYKWTRGAYALSHPDLCHPRAGNYGLTRLQHDRLRRAAILDEEAALKSASYGMFQILGENYTQAGQNSVDAFVDVMLRSSADHLAAFVTFVINSPALTRAIQKKEWADFARVYNGRDYQKNHYDTKMAAAYAALSRVAPR